MEIVLASSSPRRKRLLGKIVPVFRVSAADIVERVKEGEAFPAAAMRLAYLKAREVARKYPRTIVVGADTIAYRGRAIYRKTGKRAEAERILRELSGKTHYVVTGVMVLFPNGRRVRYSVRASVRIKLMEPGLLESYLKTGEWRGRAGCYDVSGKGARLVESICGEKETVVGLPVEKLKLILPGRGQRLK